MTIEEKKELVENLTSVLEESNNIYLTDISGLNASDTSSLRRACFKSDIQLSVVKNTLLKKAMEKTDREFNDLCQVLVGNTAIMISEKGNAPAKLIKTFRKNSERPLLKGAFIEETTYIGDEQLDALVSIKSKYELIADVVALLQSPIKNVVLALESGGQNIVGVLKTLSEK